MLTNVVSTHMRLNALPEHLLSAPAGAILAIDGIDIAATRAVMETVVPRAGGRRLLFASFDPAGTAAEIVEGFLLQLAQVALRLWPAWLDETTFPATGRDALARMATVATARTAAARHRDLLGPWLEKAALQALSGMLPRVGGTPVQTELAHLSALVCPPGLILVTEVTESQLNAAQIAALVHALEWIARHLPGPVTVLFPHPPEPGSPLERIRHGAVSLHDEESAIPLEFPPSPRDYVWLEPWRGTPHPLSEVEQRLARLIADDHELAPLFCFNQSVETVHGSRPRVDLLWREGRLVVELDGYADHTTRTAFLRDRHRDFELALSGYTVLRLANEEVVQDCWLAMQKIRDLVNHCRQVSRRER